VTSRPDIAVLSTLDTKGGEAAELKRLIEERGWPVRVVDVGLSTPEGDLADVTGADVARAGGAAIGDLRSTHHRARTMEVMGRGAGRLLQSWHRQGRLGGVLAVGGNQGTAIAAIAMRALPIGPAKLIVSTVASGNVRPFVGDADIAMLFSVADLLGGPNPVISEVLAKAGGAIVGMAEAQARASRAPLARSVAVTAFGNTHAATVAIVERLRAARRDVVPFHASGACGSAMERLVEEGAIEAILDLTTHELLGELHPEDIYSPVRPGRMTAAGKVGIPQVVVPGGLEYFCFGPPETIPARLRDRVTHHHNPYNTNVRTSAEELAEVGALMAERLNASLGPVAVLVPRLGWSEVGAPGGLLHDPQANEALVEQLRKRLRPRIALREVDATINDPGFSRLAAETLLELLPEQVNTEQAEARSSPDAPGDTAQTLSPWHERRRRPWPYKS
jgi:uncharacterized protein (UPF0261 family)